MISVPGMSSAGMQTDSFAETIDVFPTLIDLCQPTFTEIENRIDGKSLVSIIDDPQAEVKKVSFSFWRDSVSVRTMQHRLIAKIADRQRGELSSVELYSSEQQFDPVKNLAAENPDVVERLKEEFRKEVQRAKTNR